MCLNVKIPCYKICNNLCRLAEGVWGLPLGLYALFLVSGAEASVIHQDKMVFKTHRTLHISRSQSSCAHCLVE